MKPKTISLILFSIFATHGLTACDAGAQGIAEVDAQQDMTPVPVEIAYPERSDIFATYSATTTIASEGDAPVLARVPGEIVELLVEEGDRVEEGQVLARLDGKRLELEMLSAKADLERVRGEFERYADLNRRGLVSNAMYDELKYELDALNATYELSKLNYEYSNIRAPIAGVVAERNVKLGESIRTDLAAFRITDTSELVAYLTIPQTELAKFAAGHTATLSVDSMPGREFDAEVIRISPTIDVRNGTFRATAFIPAQALIIEDELTTVYVVSDGLVERRTISIGIETGGNVEVLDGLDENDQVVIVGQAALRDGSRVLASYSQPERYTG
jgi:membrane fusion protein (multidrug efflux system)